MNEVKESVLHKSVYPPNWSVIVDVPDLAPLVHTHVTTDITDIDLDQIPDGTTYGRPTHIQIAAWDNLNETYVVDDIAARDALTGLATGDKVFVKDNGDGNLAAYWWDDTGSEFLLYSDPDWENINLSWSNLVDVPTEFTPAAHTHEASEITDFSTAVAGTSSVSDNTAHSTSAGTDHSDVGLNNTHRGTVTGNPHSVTHAELSDNGTNTHSQIDTHVDDTTFHLNSTQKTDLTDGGVSALHYHSTDRDRANHTGTQAASTISDFDTEVSNNTDVAANTFSKENYVDWITIGNTQGLSPYNHIYYKLVDLIDGDASFSVELEVQIRADVNYGYVSRHSVLVSKYSDSTDRFDMVFVKTLSGYENLLEVYVYDDALWIRSMQKWGALYYRIIYSMDTPPLTEIDINTANTETQPTGELFKSYYDFTYDFDTSTDTLMDFDSRVENNTDVSAATSHKDDSTIHLTSVQKTDLTDGGDTTLHIHDARYYTESEIDGFLAAIGGNSALYLEVTQASHGFSQFNSVYHNGTSWQKAQANNEDTLGTHIVITVDDTSNFTISNIGILARTSHGLTVGEYYYTDYSTAGEITSTEPPLGYSNPLMYIPDTNNIQIFPWRPSIAEANIDIANIISENVTYDISSTGDFADFQTALEFLTHYIIAEGVYVTLQLGTGFTPVNVTQIHSQGDRIKLDLAGFAYEVTSGDAFTVIDGMTLLLYNNNSSFDSYISTADTGNGVGLSVRTNSTARLVTSSIQGIRFYDFMFGVRCNYNSFVSMWRCCVIDNGTGIRCELGSTVYANTVQAEGNTGFGFLALSGSTIDRTSASGADATDSSPAIGVTGNNNSIVV